MDREGVCVVLLMFSEWVWGAQIDPCSGREPVVRQVKDDVLICSFPNQDETYSAIGCRSIHNEKRTSCYLIYKDGTECEKRLTFKPGEQQEVLECEIENRLTPFHVKVKKKSTPKAGEPLGSEKNKTRSSNTSWHPSPSSTLQDDDCPIRLSHDSLLVEYGESAEVSCSLTTTPNASYTLGWEAQVNAVEPVEKSSVVWNVSSLTEWDMNIVNTFCFLNYNRQCRRALQLNLYKRPDSVMIDPGHGDRSEGEQRKLKCEIKSVGPVSNLTVQWTRLDQNKTRTIVKSTNFTISGRKKENDEKGDVTDTLEVRASPEEDGVQYQCAALLDLTQLEQPEVGSSQPFTITVLHKPTITQPSAATVSKTTGDALMLDCLARGKPEPQFTWTRGHSTITNSSLLNINNIQSEHQGNYTCIASNSEGSDSVTVMVTVSVPPPGNTALIILICAVVAVVLLIVGLLIYRRYSKS